MLLTYQDLQAALEIDLTDPNGQALDTELIAAAVCHAEEIIGYAIEETTVTEYFDHSQQRLWLTTMAPVSEMAGFRFNTITGAHDAIGNSYIWHQGNDVYATLTLPSGFQMVRATYNDGCPDERLPAGSRLAIIQIVGITVLALSKSSRRLPGSNEKSGDPASILPHRGV